MTEQEVEPDAWRFIETIETIGGDEKKSEQATLHHPESDKFQFYLSDIHEVSIEEPLFSADKIEEQKEKVRESIHERIRNFQGKHRDVPYPVEEIIDEELEKFEEVFQQQ